MVLFLCFNTTYAQQKVSLEAAVNVKQIALGNMLHLSFVLQGVQDVNEIPLPPLNGAQVRYIGPSSQVSIVNGVYDIKKTFHYQITPFKEGKLIVPSVEVNIQGQNYRTDSIVIDVLPAGTKIEGQDNQQEDYTEKIFLKSYVNHTQVYQGEFVLVTTKVYVKKDVLIKDMTYPAFIASEGFELGGGFQPKKLEENISGETFVVYEFLSIVVPKKIGAALLGPVVVDVLVSVKNTNQYDRSMNNPLLADRFFTDFFSQGNDHKQIRVTTDAFNLTVKDLPEEEKPLSFSGAIGQFQMDVNVSSSQIKVGDPITIRMSIKGIGDLRNVTPKIGPFEGFKAYDPVIKIEEGSLILEQVFIATDPNIKQIPSVNFSYFDPIKERYQILTQGPFPMEIMPLSKEEQAKAVAFSSNASSPLVNIEAPETFGKDVVFIREDLGKVIDIRASFFNEWWLQFVSFFYGLFIFIIWLVLRRKRFIEDNIDLMHRLKAPETACEELKMLNNQEMTDKEMATKIRHIIENLFVVLFKLPPGEVSTFKMHSLLEEKIPKEYLERMIKVLDVCSAVCFASASLSKEHREQLIKDLMEVIVVIERKCL